MTVLGPPEELYTWRLKPACFMLYLRSTRKGCLQFHAQIRERWDPTGMFFEVFEGHRAVGSGGRVKAIAKVEQQTEPILLVTFHVSPWTQDQHVPKAD